MISKAYLGTICFIVVLLCLVCSYSYAGSDTAVRFALIADKAFDLHKSPLVSLLEAKLSQEQGIELLERVQIRQVLEEQELSLTGLLQRNRTIQVGQLLRVDAFVLLSIEDSAQEKQNQKRLLRVRVTETSHGLRLLDTFEELDNAKLEELAERIVEKVTAITPKMTLPPGEAIPVGIVDIHRVQLGERYQWLARTMPAMLSARLSKERRIIMLEREDLKILHDEKLLTEGEDTEFWGSAVLVEGYLRRRGVEDVEIKLSLRRASGEEMPIFTAPVEPNEPLEAVEKATNNIIQELLNAPPSTSWQPKQEAEEFFHQGQLLRNHMRYDDALASLETAHALQPDSMFYTGAVFSNEWEQRSLKKDGFYSDLELAEVVWLLVRQIQREYNKGTLSKSYVLQEFGKPLGLGTDSYGRLSGYFAKPVSVATDEIRTMNHLNRKIWTETVRNAVVGWRGGLPVQEAVLQYAAWLSSDEPREVMPNIRDTFEQLIFHMGGGATHAGHRFMNARSTLLFPCLQMWDVPSLRNTHFRDSVEEIQELWTQYLIDLTESKDRVVRFAACLALSRYYRQKDTEKTILFCRQSLEILQTELEPLDWSGMGFFILNIRRQMSDAIMKAGFDHNEAMEVFQQIYEPLIQQGDAHNLALWGPGEHYRWWFYLSNVDVAGRSTQLLEKIAAVLETHKHEDDEVKMSLNRVKDTLATIRDRYPRLPSFNEQLSFPVRMLLSSEDWPLSQSGFRYVRVLLQKDTLWLAFAESGVGLAGISLPEKKLTSLWQANCDKGTAVYSGYKGGTISGSITGMAIGEDASYIPIRDVGLVEFPGNLTKGREFLSSPRILTKKDGLPSVSITGMAAIRNRLWLAYGGQGKESGLIIYDPKSGDFETVFCSTLKGDNPFSSGKSYEISSLAPGPEDKLFFIVCARYDMWDKIHQITGLWKININSKELKFIWHDQFIRYFLENIDDAGESWWLRDLEFLGQFDPNSEVATFILGDTRPEAQADPMPELKHGMFVPKSSVAIEFGHLIWGHISLRTAAVHGDRLWARLGKSQLIILHKGKGFQEAEIIDNNILNGDKVLRFFSTPYGLIAIGNGTVGLIETRSNL